MDASAKIEKEPTRPSEKPFSREEARVYLLSLTQTVEATVDQGVQKKLAAETELRKLSKQQLESLNQTTVEQIGLPENVKKMVETIDLRTLILNETNRQREALKQEVAKSRSETGKDKEKTEAGKKDDATDKAWIPDSIDPSTWNGRQISVASTATLGAVGLLYLAWKKWRQPKPNSEIPAVPVAAVPQKNRVLTFLSWIPVVGLGATALYAAHKMLLKFDPYTKAFAAMQEKYEAFEKRVAPFVEKGKEKILHPLGEGKWEKYGVKKENYEKAENLYQAKGKAAKNEIAKQLDLEGAEKSVQLEQFMADMASEHDGQEIEVGSGVHYLPAKEALKNYENEIEDALKAFGHWLESHEGTLFLTGVVFAKIGILKSILSSGLSVTTRAASIVATVTQWGIKSVIKHPLISLLAFGGTYLAAKKVGEKVRLPENLHQLYLACAGDQPLAINEKGKKADEPVLAALQPQIKNWVMEDSIGPWVKKQIKSLMDLILETAPEAALLSREELIAKNNMKGFRVLWQTLDERLSEASRTTKDRDNGTGEKCMAAMEILEELEITFIRSRCTDSKEKDTSVELLQALKEALSVEEINITLEVRGNIAKWQGKDMERPNDLCVDPAISDRETVENVSKMLRQEQDTPTLLARDLLDEMRRMGNDAKEKGEKWVDDKILATVVGSFLIVIDPTEQIPQFWKIPLDTAGHVLDFAQGDENGGQFIASISNGIISSAVFSVSAELCSKLKQFAIGGGEILPQASTIPGKALMKVRFVATRLTPGVSQIYWGKRIFGTWRDVVAFRASGRGGRLMTIACAKAGIDPRWISVIETTKNIERLRPIAKALRCADPEGVSFEALKSDILERMKMRLEKVRLRGIEATTKKLLTGQWLSAVEGEKQGLEGVLESFKTTFADVKQMRADGMTVQEIFQTGIQPKRMLEAGVLPKELLDAGIEETELLKAGVSKTDIKVAMEEITKANELAAKTAETRKAVQATDTASNTAKAAEDAASVSKEAPKSGAQAPDGKIAAANGAEVVSDAKTTAKPASEGVPVTSEVATSKGTSTATAEAAKEAKDFGSLQREIDAARKTGNTAEVARLATENTKAIQVAAEAGDAEAKALLHGLDFAKKWTAGKVAMKGLPFIGTAIDVYLIRANEVEIAKATAKGDLQKVADLKSERSSLLGAGAGGLLWAGAETAGALGFGNGAILTLPGTVSGGVLGATASGLATGAVLVAPIVAASFYREAIKESVAEWKKSEQEYAQISGAKLLGEIRKKMTERTTGTAAANGDTMVQSLIVGTPERYQKKFDETERNINRPMREKMYGAYFMKYTQAPWTEADTELAERELEEFFKERTNVSKEERKQQSDLIIKNIVKQRFNEAVADKKRFIEHVSITGEGFSSAKPQELAQADDYAEVRSVYRNLVSKGQKPELKYKDASGAERILDLSAFRFAGEPTAEAKIEIRNVLNAYRNDIKIPRTLAQQSMGSLLAKNMGTDYPNEQKAMMETAEQGIRKEILTQLRHHILHAEEQIEAYALGESTQDRRVKACLIREEVRREFEGQYDQFISKIGEQIHTPEEYQSWIKRMEEPFAQVSNIEATRQKARKFLPEAESQTIFTDIVRSGYEKSKYREVLTDLAL